jgi:hypothetical protein
MKPFSILLVVALLGAGLVPGRSAEPPAPHFQDVLRLLRAHLPGVTDQDLDRAAVEGFVRYFQPRVQWITGDATAFTNPPPGEVGEATVYQGRFAYVRVLRIGPGITKEFRAAFDRLAASNKVAGLVLDLRFTSGFDFAAAGHLAATFVDGDLPLLSWGDENIRATSSTNVLSVPTAILVNSETTGAPEAVAAALRVVDRAVIVGSPTAGQARVFRDFALGEGQTLRIATGVVQAGEDQALDHPVSPDILVEVTRDRERAFMTDPYRVEGTASAAGLGATNGRPRHRINEAELVRLRREGLDPENAGGPARSSPPPAAADPVVQDPALARALDLLKGITLFQAPVKAG